jgi:hypothetical protein
MVFSTLFMTRFKEFLMLAFITLKKSFSRPTTATNALVERCLLSAATVGFVIMFHTQVVPQFQEIGFGTEYELVVRAFACLIALTSITFIACILSAWKDVVSHQAKNDVAGFNRVGKAEAYLFSRYDRPSRRASNS